MSHSCAGTNAEGPGSRGWLNGAELAFDALLRNAHLAAADELPGLVANHARELGLEDAVAYLVDLQQTLLIPFLGSSGPGLDLQRDALSIDGTLAGRSYQFTEVLTQRVERGTKGQLRVWAPLVDGTERLGLLAATVSDEAALLADGGALERRLHRLAAVVAEIVMTKTMYGDTIVQLRRNAPMSLAAEIQWGMLPPLTFASRDLIIAGALEPAYEVAGDSVDYAVDHGVARFAIFDGMGHGLHSAQLAALTVAAYRNARRAGMSLIESAQAIEIAVHTIYGGEAFTTGILGQLDATAGQLQWVNAGHPEPLVLRHGRLVRTLRIDPGLPFGLATDLDPARRYAIGTEQLEEGDRVVLYTDGVVDARDPDGAFFGVETLVDFLVRKTDDRLPAPETMRRLTHALLAHSQGQPDDDATLLMVEWRSGQEVVLLPTPAA